MSDEDIAKRFLTCYKKHDFYGMHDCLDENVTFSDFAFDIQGKEVRAMWHWFCIPYLERKKPIDVPEFDIIQSEGDVVLAKYSVSYLYGEKQRPVDYSINVRFKLQNGKIVEQEDTFGSVSQFEFAEMAFGFPLKLLALTPLLRIVVKKKAGDKLRQFMRLHKNHGY
ncbi:MAG: nuclear transport factor 2 family protein [Cyanothece sp. SIO1E1]|nr:nuclear transport factor 2 family protein [Cyanothece sp. SIO1E1]